MISSGPPGTVGTEASPSWMSLLLNVDIQENRLVRRQGILKKGILKEKGKEERRNLERKINAGENRIIQSWYPLPK